MSIGKLLAAFIARKPLTWAFHVVTLGLGVGVVIAVLLLSQALDQRFARDLHNVNLVVGAKGSPLQLIMSAVFQIDTPTGNIPVSVAEKIAASPLVAQSATISMGDAIGEQRIIGTTPAYGALYGAQFARGRWFSAPMEVVLGAEAAIALKADINSKLIGQHGLTGGGEMHSEFPYHVVGVLAPTGAVIDRVVLTPTESVWKLHDHEAMERAGASGTEAAAAPERQVTALLVKYKSAMGALMLPRQIKAMPDIQAAIPAIEIARLNVLFGAGAGVLRGFGFALLALSALGFFVALFAAVQQRAREFALLRALGAHRSLLLSLIALESLVLGLIGGLLGVIIGRVAAAITAHATAGNGGPALDIAPIGVVDITALAAAAALSLLAALAPSLMAYRLDPARVMKEG